MLKFILSIILGNVLHRIVKPRTRLMDHGWPSLTEQTLGTMLVFPFFLLWYYAFQDVKKERDRLTGAFFLAALGVGLGDAAGYYFESSDTAPSESPPAKNVVE